MIELFFGLAVLALLVIGLQRRKNEKKRWVEEERHDESGRWIDKRPGERGTFGSLDEEMESNRQYIARQAKTVELARLAQNFCFERLPDFHRLSEKGLKEHFSRCQSEASMLLLVAEKMAQGAPPGPVPASDGANDRAILLKKMVLSFLYAEYPRLLDAEIEQLKRLDLAAAHFAERVMA
jgi:hypothetical protein